MCDLIGTVVTAVVVGGLLALAAAARTPVAVAGGLVVLGLVCRASRGA